MKKLYGKELDDDFSVGFGVYEYISRIDFGLWESLKIWLHELPDNEKEIISIYYLKFKKISRGDDYLEKSLQVHFLFKLRLERIIFSLEHLKIIIKKIFQETEKLAHYRSVDLLTKNINRYSSYISVSEIHKLHKWDQKYFTNLSMFQSSNVVGVKDFKFIVHMIGEEYFNRTDFSNLEDNMNTWDAISTSVVSENNKYFYYRFGVILSIPKQNILLTFTQDAMFENHIGNSKMDKYQLTSKKYSENKIKNNGLLTKHIKSKYNTFYTPDEIIKKTYAFHNEIIVCGRNGVNIHPNFPCTGKIKIAGIVIVNDKNNPTSIKNSQMILEATKNLQKKYSVPIIRIDGQVDVTSNQ
ncbi:hypothetical protein [Silvanigrella aquatica]|uniref:Uncharacterized protein n=1 Tax=Silvanigrella aquatica TaxID=1915309 RepID=A0A1L4D3G4_9BACT|nr:hypothetical protein [Silvanigrella aquatica]APJ04734.1 hypothetical protein AXG55_12840 [Silvanigrella aquatica]